MTATMSFTCNICGEESTRICARCTKDTCNNHLCEKCARCSDCCECEITRDESVRPVVRPPVGEPVPVPDPEPDVASLVAEEGAPVPQDFETAEISEQELPPEVQDGSVEPEPEAESPWPKPE
jgi:hypothetical protein